MRSPGRTRGTGREGLGLWNVGVKVGAGGGCLEADFEEDFEEVLSEVSDSRA